MCSLLAVDSQSLCTVQLMADFLLLYGRVVGKPLAKL